MFPLFLKSFCAKLACFWTKYIIEHKIPGTNLVFAVSRVQVSIGAQFMCRVFSVYVLKSLSLTVCSLHETILTCFKRLSWALKEFELVNCRQPRSNSCQPSSILVMAFVNSPQLTSIAVNLLSSVDPCLSSHLVSITVPFNWLCFEAWGYKGYKYKYNVKANC